MLLFDKKRMEKEVWERKKRFLTLLLVAGFLLFLPIIGAPAFEIKQQDLTSSNIERVEESTGGDNLVLYSKEVIM